MAKKKVLTLFTATTMAALMTISMAACGEPTTKDPEVTGISITTAPTKTHYVLGENFDATGMVVSKVYDNETTEAIPATEYTFTPDTALKLSDKEVVVKWTSEADVEYTAKQKISVTNDVAKVVVKTEANKKDYLTGELFDPTGMTIEGFLENGDSDGVVEVNKDTVTYKTTGLSISDAQFEMNYGGYDFIYEISVNYGVSMEAENALILNSGVQIDDEDGPSISAIEKDFVNAADPSNGGHRGIDQGDACTQGDNCTYGSPRVNVKFYIHDQLELTNTTGGTEAGSGRMMYNHLIFKEGKGGEILAALDSAEAGKVDVTFKMGNPYRSGATAPEGKLNEVFEISVNGKAATISDSSVIGAVDWSEYKAYNKATKQYDGDALDCKYCWQYVTVTIDVEKGLNNINIKSICPKNVRVDSISFKAQSELVANAAFKPEVQSAQLKVEGEKVLLGVIVNPNKITYSDEILMGALQNLKMKGGKLGSNWNYEQGRDPWTQSVANGGLGYNDRSLSDQQSMGTYFEERTVEKVELITEGDYKDMYFVWYDITIPNDTKFGTTPDKNRYLGAWHITQYNYGAALSKFKPNEEILRDGTSITAELNGFCYQIFCDGRDMSDNEFGGGYLSFVIQAGTFVEANATETCPLRGLVARRYLDWIGADRNDPDIWANHHPAE